MKIKEHERPAEAKKLEIGQIWRGVPVNGAPSGDLPFGQE
jgi:hypothetical protein